MKRRDLLRGIAALVPASSVLGHYSALAAPLRKKVKITDLKVMVVGKPGGNTLVRIDTDAGISGYGEAWPTFSIFRYPRTTRSALSVRLRRHSARPPSAISKRTNWR